MEKLARKYSLSDAYIIIWLAPYYPNGNLKFRVEAVDNKYWNFLTYRYPDGKDYDFGDFKDGEGTVVHLNDEGFPCLECTSKINKKTRGKILCGEPE